MEHSLPQWLQKELDQFGLFSYEDKPVAKIKYPQQQQQPTGWMPSFVGEQPPF